MPVIDTTRSRPRPRARWRTTTVAWIVAHLLTGRSGPRCPVHLGRLVCERPRRHRGVHLRRERRGVVTWTYRPPLDHARPLAFGVVGAGAAAAGAFVAAVAGLALSTAAAAMVAAGGWAIGAALGLSDRQ